MCRKFGGMPAPQYKLANEILLDGRTLLSQTIPLTSCLLYSGSRKSDYGGDQYGSFSSAGGCCPLVVDPLTYAALIGFIALATYFFNEQIAMPMLARSFSTQYDWIFQGRR